MNLMCPPWYFEMYQQRLSGAVARRNASMKQKMTNGSAANGSAANGFDSDEMGMTLERQQQIQASLFKMLGQADDDETATAESSTKEASTAADPPTTAS